MLRHWLLIKEIANIFGWVLTLDLHNCWSRDIAIVVYLVMILILISFFVVIVQFWFFFSSLNMWLDLLHLEYHYIAWFIKLTNCLKMSVTSTSMTSFWRLYCWIWTCLTLSSVVDFEELNVWWEFFYISYLLETVFPN